MSHKTLFCPAMFCIAFVSAGVATAQTQVKPNKALGMLKAQQLQFEHQHLKLLVVVAPNRNVRDPGNRHQTRPDCPLAENRHVHLRMLVRTAVRFTTDEFAVLTAHARWFWRSCERESPVPRGHFPLPLRWQAAQESAAPICRLMDSMAAAR